MCETLRSLSCANLCAAPCLQLPAEERGSPLGVALVALSGALLFEVHCSCNCNCMQGRSGDLPAVHAWFDWRPCIHRACMCAQGSPIADQLTLSPFIPIIPFLCRRAEPDKGSLITDPWLAHLPEHDAWHPAPCPTAGVLNPHEGSLITDPLKAALRQAGALHAAAQVRASSVCAC